MRFLSLSSPVDWTVGSREAYDALKATGVAMAEMGFQQVREAVEEDCWVDALDGEALRGPGGASVARTLGGQLGDYPLP